MMLKQNSISHDAPSISQEAYQQLEYILKTSPESSESTLGELHWNACKRQIHARILNNLKVR